MGLVNNGVYGSEVDVQCGAESSAGCSAATSQDRDNKLEINLTTSRRAGDCVGKDLVGHLKGKDLMWETCEFPTYVGTFEGLLLI